MNFQRDEMLVAFVLSITINIYIYIYIYIYICKKTERISETTYQENKIVKDRKTRSISESSSGYYETKISQLTYTVEVN